MNLPNLNLSAFAPELMLAGGALLVLLVGAFRRDGRLGPTVGALALVVALWVWWKLSPTAWAFGGDYGGDGTSFFARGFFLVTALALTILVATGKALRSQNITEFIALLYISVLGMMVMASAQNWVIIFLGLETMSIPLYVMAAYFRSERTSVEAGVKYFIYGAFASAFLVYGIALLYASVGTVDEMLLRASAPLDALAVTGLVLILVGLAFKVAAVPFHMWAPDAYAGAPTIVTAFFAVAPKAAGFVALWRLVSLADGLGEPVLTAILTASAVLTIIFGNLWALVQVQLKRMLAYSSIAHAGYLMLALVALDFGGGTALLFYLVAYALMTLGAFVVLLAFERDGVAETYEDISGGAGRHPLLALAMTVFMVSLSGIPATAGFIGKFQIFKSLLVGGHLGLVLVAVAGSLVSVAYYLRVIVYLYMRPQPELAARATPPAWNILVVTLALVVLLLGLFPDLLWPTLADWATRSAFGMAAAAP